MISKEQRFAFFVGTWVGAAQVFVGLIVSLRGGGAFGAFFSSLIVYLALFSAFKWAVGTKEETKDERSKP